MFFYYFPCTTFPSPATKALGAPLPDFLWRLMALIHSMRLSLMKGAHADLSSTAWQEIGVKPYFGLSGLGCLPNPFVIKACGIPLKPKYGLNGAPSIGLGL